MTDPFTNASPVYQHAKSLGNRNLPLIRTKDAPGWLSIGVGYGLFFLALAVIWRVLF